jgi:hypothetical protein
MQDGVGTTLRFLPGMELVSPPRYLAGCRIRQAAVRLNILYIFARAPTRLALAGCDIRWAMRDRRISKRSRTLRHLDICHSIIRSRIVVSRWDVSRIRKGYRPHSEALEGPGGIGRCNLSAISSSQTRSTVHSRKGRVDGTLLCNRATAGQPETDGVTKHHSGRVRQRALARIGIE